MPRLLFVVLLAVVPAAAQEPARDHDITLDDYFTLAAITELAVSPDGKHVAYCEGRWDKADDRKTDLWVVATDGKGKPTRLTGDRANDRHPKWSADGKAIYVLGNRKREAEKKPPYDGTTQVWQVPLDGGDPRAVTRVEGGVTGFDYAPKADALFYSRRRHRPRTRTTSPTLRSKYKAEYGHGTRKVSEVHRLDLQDVAGREGDRREALRPRVRRHAGRQAGRDGRRPRRHGDQVRGRVAGRRVGAPDVSEGRSSRRRRTLYRAKAASPYAVAGVAGVAPGRRRGSPSAPSSTPTRPRSSSASSRTATWIGDPDEATASGRPRPRLRHRRCSGATTRRSAYLGERNGRVASWLRATETNVTLGMPRKDRGRLGVRHSARRRWRPPSLLAGGPTEFPDLVPSAAAARSQN